MKINRKRKTIEIIIEFQRPPHLMFNLPEDARLTPNLISLCIQPDEGIHLGFQAKVPDSDQAMRSVDMDFHYRDSFNDHSLPEAYERLLLEALKGDAAHALGLQLAQAVNRIPPAFCYVPAWRAAKHAKTGSFAEKIGKTARFWHCKFGGRGGTRPHDFCQAAGSILAWPRSG